MKVKQTTIALSGLFLIIAIAVLAWANYARGHYQQPWTKLENRLPREIAGWTSIDLPLADTELVKQAVEDHLNYDDYIYRQYTLGGKSVYIYAMFWRQGRISVREMAGHTPDGCWITSGARQKGEKTREAIPYLSGLIIPGEFRFFEFPGSAVPVNVIWWHVWGGEIVPSALEKKSPLAVMHEVWTWLWVRRGRPADQIFIRIHTVGDLRSMDENPVLIKFLKLFPELRASHQG